MSSLQMDLYMFPAAFICLTRWACALNVFVVFITVGYLCSLSEYPLVTMCSLDPYKLHLPMLQLKHNFYFYFIYFFCFVLLSHFVKRYCSLS